MARPALGRDRCAVHGRDALQEFLKLLISSMAQMKKALRG